MDYRVFQMVEALVLVRVGSGEAMNFMKTVKQEIGKVKGVKKVYGIFGRYDFAVMIETKTNEEMGNLVTDCIRGINGVVYTETLLIGF
jgi:DNA-binding Lrp family transcriptional regulator